ncbi:MAG TPA: HEAT repeat domain-containing protein [Gemmataceae bacterium]|nr:HEAT repeat domain-containing protein [Gemmataceae bacterium]
MERHLFCGNRCLRVICLAGIVLVVAGPVFAHPIPAFRVQVKIDPKTPLEKLLPEPPVVSRPVSPWLVKDLAEVPEIQFQKPLPKPENIVFQEGEFKILMGKEEIAPKPGEIGDSEKKIFRIIQEIAHINHLNAKGTDHFLKLLIKQRADLAGLPFAMGDACRMSKETSRQFKTEIESVRNALDLSSPEFWKRYRPQERKADQKKPPVRIAALMQMLAAESPGVRKGLVQYLKGMEGAEATAALARLAVFSFEEEIRTAALDALEGRPEKESAGILLSGLRYPWPAVSANAAQAITTLQRKDLVPALVAFLDEPDPRAPAETKIAGRRAIVVKELVRLNHHHNCLLCHAPGNTADVYDDLCRAKEIVTGPVPIPDREFTGYGFVLPTPDLLVRADVTYLRQDFSLMRSVKNASPWPDLQRYDFLVRTREITDREADAYRVWREKQGPDYRSPHHQAALHALRAITGLDAGSTSEAWRRLLAVKEQRP